MNKGKIILQPGYSLRNGKYIIEEFLGFEYSKITYKAKARGGDTTYYYVVIKEFFMGCRKRLENGFVDLTGYEFELSQFMRVTNMLSNLNHDNIVKVIDAFDENNTYYAVYEFISGTSVYQFVKNKGYLPEGEALHIVKEIGFALNYMHSHKMLNLDVNPQNMILTRNGHVYLADSYPPEDDDEDSLPRNIGYMPPEGDYDYITKSVKSFSVDIYGLGASFYWMITGDRPPTFGDIIENNFPTWKLKQFNISSNTIRCIEKSMHPRMKRRFKTIEEFLEALHIPMNKQTSEETEFQEYDEDVFVEKTNEFTTVH